MNPRKKTVQNGLFSIQSEGMACNLTAGEYVIAEGVWHHASACILIDYIQHFVLIPYRRQAVDFIHGFAVILRVAFLYYEHKALALAGAFLFLKASKKWAESEFLPSRINGREWETINHKGSLDAPEKKEDNP